MPRSAHPWGTPPWTIDVHPAKAALPERVDFAIVGAGFAGLSTAAWLARLAPQKSIIVLESGTVGNGASGRTGGMVLDQTAAGPLPGLGNVLAGYKTILRELKIAADLALPGAVELARHKTLKHSPISWQDSGDLRVARRVPGGSIDPGKVVSGLAHAAQKAGALIFEHAEVTEVVPQPKSDSRDDVSQQVTLRVRLATNRGIQQKSIHAARVLLATNAGSLSLGDLAKITEPKLTLALATAPLTEAQLKTVGLSSRQPFYTIDFPYLWGRLLENNGVIFGAGLLPQPTAANSPFNGHHARHPKLGFGELLRFDVRKGATRASFARLESRIRNMHPALRKVRITHRWGGPILFTENFHPIFRHHARSKNILMLGGFCGHGVALSVYLGHWAAQALLRRRPLPRWRVSG